MIDIHAHLCFPDFDRDIGMVVERSRKELAGVIVSSARHGEGVKALELCRKNRGFLFPTLGHHPTEGDEWDRVIELIRENKEEIVGVGEVGLDYHWEKDPGKKADQRRVFQEFIGLAQEISKPLVIHSWDAERDCFEMVRDSGLTAVFHCFSGKRDLAQEIVSVPGFYISISTQVLFNRSIRKVAKAIPLDRLLLETDAPFLSPEKMKKPKGGTKNGVSKDDRNFPWNIILSAEKIAQLRHIDSAEVLNAARENAIQAFGLELE